MLIAGVGLAGMAAGCGGSGSGFGGARPSEETRAKLLAMHDSTVRGLLQSGGQTASFAVARNSEYADSPAGSGPGGGNSAPTPMVGAFLRHLAVNKHGFAEGSTGNNNNNDNNEEEGQSGGSGSTEPSPPRPDDEPPTPNWNPDFYFDYYLGLWVATQTPGDYNHLLLFEDEVKTKPAGHITSNFPEGDTYPQSSSSNYEFTAGYLAGSHGFSEYTIGANGSGESRYENVYSDGWSDSGTSRWSANGDFTWNYRSTGPDSFWSEGAGTFHANGSGSTKDSSSDGYKSDYRYNTDGTGSGTISGPDPGLPAKIRWDAEGNTWITYADGSKDYIPGWGGYAGGGAEPLLAVADRSRAARK